MENIFEKVEVLETIVASSHEVDDLVREIRSCIIRKIFDTS